MEGNNTGFTLVELLVVVLIIGILAAVAVPQYQKAVLKSRFSSLMPTTKAIRDGNEAYYMEHGLYGTQLTDLDVTVTPQAETRLSLTSNNNYAYVMATRDDLTDKNHLIMYQKYSATFPGETHCEAKTGDTQAQWLCGDALKGSLISGSLTSGFSTYVLQGSGTDGFVASFTLVTSASDCNTNICRVMVAGNASVDGTMFQKGTEVVGGCSYHPLTHNPLNCVIYDLANGTVMESFLNETGEITSGVLLSMGKTGDWTEEELESFSPSGDPDDASLVGRSIYDLYPGIPW